MKIENQKDQFIANTYSRFPVSLQKGKGAIVYDENNKRYIDLGSGIAVNTFGYSDDQWKDAITSQIDKLQHTSNLYYTEPSNTLAQLLCEKTGMKKVFFSNSGAEANECAIKVARRFASKQYGEGHDTIITLRNSFHGRTMATLAATGQDSFHTDFGQMLEGFVYADPQDSSDVRRLAEEHECVAIMMELIQGEGGVYQLSQAFVDDVIQIAKEKDLLLIIDEVQTGNGRTGKLYSYMHYGFQPDIITTAKGLGGGLPLGATLLDNKVKDVLTPGTHGSTFGGNPVCCAGAISIISRLDEAFMQEINDKSEYIVNQLSGAIGVRSISGKGLMIGIECVKDAKEVIVQCLEKGVLVLSAKNKIRLLPPLNISKEHLEEAIIILKEVLSQ